MIIKPSKSFSGSTIAETAQARFLAFLDSLPWRPGQRDQSSWHAFLRAKTLLIDPTIAINEVARRITISGGAADPAKLKNQAERAYTSPVPDQTIEEPRLAFSPEKLKQFASAAPGITEDWLIAHSPIDPTAVTSSDFLDHLYEPGESIIIFTDYKSRGQTLYTIGEKFNPPLPSGSPEGVWFLTNPVDGQERPNPRQGGKLSRRSEESITSWRYLLLESDVAERKEWLAALVQMPLPIVAIYTSGGKSIHALVPLDAASKEEWNQMKNESRALVIPLGADENAMSAVRLSRLPATKRGTNEQRLLYMNPEPTGKPIFQP